MRFILSLPLTLIPLIAYNVIVFGSGADAPAWQEQVFAVQMVSGAQFQLLLGDVLLTFALVLLFAEMLKATRTGSAALMDHILSMLVFVAYLVEFLIAAPAATSIFFILMVIALIDVIAGFSITISGARRDVAFGHDDR
ncbi:hypothetical protein [Roseibium litorale]|uniref:Transmembrane protein n=1 Tax=Roseibium litorale TaxID=2803841 RepID=A0ABR9CLA8_9HYPH|nr:hypothetical protein [Roseibium litorale]MBD8891621.1 hypothetical protein [Roseibium litorale]